MIHLTQIDKWFGPHQVLKGIDLQLAEGSVTALIGPSGSGKSTLLRCVNLLEIPQAGELQLGAASIRFAERHTPSRAQIQAIRQQTGMVFQNFLTQAAAVEVCVDFCRADAFMSEHTLYGTQVGTSFE